MNKVSILFLSLFVLATINMNLQADIFGKEPLSEEKKKQIRQEFSDSFCFEDSLYASTQAAPRVVFNVIASAILIKSICWLIGISDQPGISIGSLGGGTLVSAQAYKEAFYEITKNRSIMKCKEYNLSGDECFHTLKESEYFKNMMYSQHSPFKTPQEFKDEYNKTK